MVPGSSTPQPSYLLHTYIHTDIHTPHALEKHQSVFRPPLLLLVCIVGLGFLRLLFLGVLRPYEKTRRHALSVCLSTRRHRIHRKLPFFFSFLSFPFLTYELSCITIMRAGERTRARGSRAIFLAFTHGVLYPPGLLRFFCFFLFFFLGKYFFFFLLSSLCCFISQFICLGLIWFGLG